MWAGSGSGQGSASSGGRDILRPLEVVTQAQEVVSSAMVTRVKAPK